MQSVKPPNIYVQQKNGPIEIRNKPGFQSCAAYDFNSLIFKESDGDASSIALTIGDSFNNDKITDDEWLTLNNDKISCIDFYALKEDELEDNAIRFSEDLSSSEIEGYCIIDNFGQLHTVNVVTRNINNEFQSDVEDNNTHNLNIDSINLLQQPQETAVGLCTNDRQTCMPLSVQNITDSSKQSSSLKEGSLTNRVQTEFKTVRVCKDSDKLVNLKKSVSKNHSDSHKSNSSENISANLPVVTIPQKYILSGRIISKNILPLLKNQVFLSPRPNNVEKPTSSLLNNKKNSKEKSLLKCNILKSKDSYKEKKECNSEQKSRKLIVNSTSKCSDEAKSVEFDNSLINSNVNISTKKSNMPLAVVEITTNKVDDITEIVIKTDGIEELYKGKTSEMMKAIKNTYSKCNLLADKNSESTNKIKNYVVDVDDQVTFALKSIGVDRNAYIAMESESGEFIGFVCPVEECQSTFEKPHKLDLHILSHYNVRPFKCDYSGCNWSFYSNFHLKRHKETHFKTKHFKCTYNSCERTFTTIYNLNTHLKLHARPAAIKCTVDGCEETFQTKRTLELHLKSHGKIYAPYICKTDGCGKCYFSLNSFQAHSRTHKHTLDDLRCEYCHKIFDLPCRLKAHVRAHTGVKPYKCTFEGCDWAFPTSSKLRRHEHKHTQVRKFTCNLCFKSFLRGEHLKDHRMKHYVCKTFMCPVADCNMNFRNRSSVYAHLKKRHGTKPESPVKQTFCDNWPVALFAGYTSGVNAQSTGSADNNSLDSIEMLTEDNLISTMESLQYNEVDVNRTSTGGTSGLSFNGINTEGLMVGLPELINSYTPPLDQDLNSTLPNPAHVTHILVTETKDNENLNIAPDGDLMELSNDNIGSARTSLTYQETLQDRERRKSRDLRKTSLNSRKRLVSLNSNDKAKVCFNLDSPTKEHLGLRVASDVVLSAGLLGGSQDNLTRSLLLQDELSTGDLYGGSQVPEDTSLLGSSGELLCDDATPRHSDFEQSTINLRDLE